jgi:hypothetical protein
MPARDLYHDEVVAALIKDGWTITDDPLHLRLGKQDAYVDLGAEKLVAAEKEGRKIGVEVKSFAGPSLIADLEQALGQFALYETMLARLQPDRVLYIALPNDVYDSLFDEPLGKALVEDTRIRLIVFEPLRQEIVQWID